FLPVKMAHTSVDSILTVPFSADTTQTGSATLTLRVSSAQDSASQGIVVKYRLVGAPASTDVARPAVPITHNTNPLVTADTTNSAGTSSRRLVVISALLSDAALVGGAKTDTARIEASASYKGVPLNGSPVQFKIPIKVALK